MDAVIAEIEREVMEFLQSPVRGEMAWSEPATLGQRNRA